LLKEITDYYNLEADEFSRTRKEPWPEIEFLFDSLNLGEKVLDLGCGNGRFFRFFKKRKVDYFGTDASPKLVEIAKRENPGARFETADALNLPFPGNNFDKIYSIAVLHHIPSYGLRMKFLKEAERVLKPGGILVLTCWKLPFRKMVFLNLKSLLSKIFKREDMDKGDVFVPWRKKARRYYHIFSEKELGKIVKESRFTIEKSGIVKNEKRNRQNFYIVAKKQPSDYLPEGLRGEMGRTTSSILR